MSRFPTPESGLLVVDYDVLGEHVERVAEVVAERDALRAALAELLRMTNTIEVLGEWEAADINRSLRAKNRALVDACIAKARAALEAKP